MTTTQTTNSTIKYVTWQVPIDYSQHEMERVQDERIMQAMKQVEKREFITHEELGIKMQNWFAKQEKYENNLD